MITPYAILTSRMNKKDESEMRKRVKQWTVIGVTDENVKLSSVISDFVMPYKIKVTKYCKHI